VVEATSVGAGDPADERLAHSPVVTTVFEQILAAVHGGELLPGQRISDGALAEQLGVSRTPVREALLRLREIGIVEASASRFTRIADVTPLQTKQAFEVWLPLYRTLLEEVIPAGTGDAAEEMARDHEQFLESLTNPDPQRLATTTFWFFQRLTDRSSNPALQRALMSVVHILRLGSTHLPEYMNMELVTRAQRMLLEAVRANDLVGARRTMALLAGLEIPQE